MRSAQTAVLITLLFVDRPAVADHIDASGILIGAQEYCHIIRFPQGWKVPVEFGKSAAEPGLIFHYDYNDDYEFRVSGLQGSRFLVTGLIRLPAERETTNRYEVDFSDPKAPVRKATDQQWRAATPVRLTQKDGFESRLYDRLSPLVKFGTFQLTKTGEVLSSESSRLSPDHAWIVLQSWTGTSMDNPNTHIFVCPLFGCRGKVFFDVFDADTGKKLLTVEARYTAFDPDTELIQPGWLTERYFVVPLGEHRERCLVCEFGRKSQGGAKP